MGIFLKIISDFFVQNVLIDVINDGGDPQEVGSGEYFLKTIKNLLSFLKMFRLTEVNPGR